MCTCNACKPYIIITEYSGHCSLQDETRNEKYMGMRAADEKNKASSKGSNIVNKCI